MIEYSSNLMDLKLDIGMTIQKIQAGKKVDIINHLESIQKAIHKITYQ